MTDIQWVTVAVVMELLPTSTATLLDALLPHPVKAKTASTDTQIVSKLTLALCFALALIRAHQLRIDVGSAYP
jgi:hypothetical protein